MSGETGRAIVLGGKTGLLGQPLTAALAKAGFAVLPTTRADLDPFDAAAVARAIDDFEASHLFNTVAHTAVDKAEDEPEAAYRLNRDLPALLAGVCRQAGTRLVHYSTDFVFDGAKAEPYLEEDATAPQSVYGASKLAGERAIADSGLDRYQILRTAWLYGPGKRNFVATIIGLAREREVIRVVVDQYGSPTYTLDLADCSVALARNGTGGLFHVVNLGEANWCELAAEAVAASGIVCRVVPISSAEYPQKAKRPPFSVLDTGKLARTIGRAPRPWLQTVREYVYQLTADISD